MSKEDWKWLRNESGLAVKCVFEGKLFEIEPGEVRQFHPDVADAMLEEHGESVVWDRYFGQRVTNEEALSANVWVANMTGCPYYPEEIRVPRYDPQTRKQYTDTIRNKVRETPRTLRREMKGGTQIVQGRSGDEQFNNPGRTLILPAQRRKQFTPAEANWFLARSSNAAMVSGSPESVDAILSRPPTDFEPDPQTWSYEDMLVYCEMVDSKLRRGKLTAKQLTAQLEKKQGESPAMFENRKKTYLRRAAETLYYDYLYYYVVNPRITLPTKAQFEARKKGTTSSEEKVQVSA